MNNTFTAATTATNNNNLMAMTPSVAINSRANEALRQLGREISEVESRLDAVDQDEALAYLTAAKRLVEKRTQLLAISYLARMSAKTRSEAFATANCLLVPIAAYARKAMDGGCREAVTFYADALYDEGSRDRSALKCYARLALVGNPHATCRAGWMLVLGRGERPNETEGWRLIRLAAELGDADARALIIGRECSRAKVECHRAGAKRRRKQRAR